VHLKLGEWQLRQKFNEDGPLVSVTEAWWVGRERNTQVDINRDGGGPRGSVAFFGVPTYCRRDDYPFLPPGAQGGLPCVGARHEQSFDPEAFARQLVQDIPLPSIQLGMNPRLGMVAVPTWFWVEGYDGAIFGRSESLLLVKRSCELVVVRDDAGDPLLDVDGRPTVREECTTTTDTVTVEVRLWPTHYVWDFGDRNGQPVACFGIGACPAGLGEVFTDTRHPSPIRHAYVWSSLNQGTHDAYTVGLAIDFGAQFRLSFNGETAGGWQDAPSRSGAWSAAHQVQEAQAVLTRGP